MITKMAMAKLELVDKNTKGSQMVAVLNKPYDISIRYAKIP
ncbi:MAG TPA: L-threonine dehydrogenase, partial [Clostridiaceae bacterium]|nr:L-threonine dehydrogenase [Clostridiaceae bacterium]